MIVVASANGRIGIEAAVDVLKSGGSAVDAVEAGTRLVEANPDDHSVGYNGWPNVLGELELDASIMDGRSLMSGAVGAMKGYPYAISVARKVMETLPHVLLVGEGAERFAAEMSCEAWSDMFTDEVCQVWQRRLQQATDEADVSQIAQRTDLHKLVRFTTDPERTWGTVNFIAQDSHGDIACAVSTSGWAWKYPGRLGDSPIIGAGNYADNRWGAAACTGMGEMAIRASTAHSLVFYMKMGLSVAEAGERAMQDLNDLGGRFLSTMNLIAVDNDGNHTGYTNVPGRTYIYQTADMPECVELERTVVPIQTQWAHD
jgi:beta-aspartyl-peptidase (threonine type)